MRDISRAAFTDALLEFQEVPELFYVPEHWTLQARREWESSNAEQRSDTLQSRHGWVADDMPVLPFTAQLEDGPQRVHPDMLGSTIAPITLLITPIPYIGPTKQLRAYFEERYILKDRSKHNPTGVSWFPQKGVTWESLADFRLSPPASNIVDYLETCYRQKKPEFDGEYLTLYKHLRDRWLDAHIRAARSGQPYAITGVESNWDTSENSTSLTQNDMGLAGSPEVA